MGVFASDSYHKLGIPCDQNSFTNKSKLNKSVHAFDVFS